MSKKEEVKLLTKNDLNGIEKSINSLDQKISVLDRKVSKLEERVSNFEARNEKEHQDLQNRIDEKFNKILNIQDRILNELQALRQETIFESYLFKQIEERVGIYKERVENLEIKVKKLEEKIA